MLPKLFLKAFQSLRAFSKAMRIGQLTLPVQPRLLELEDPVPASTRASSIRSVKPERIQKKLDEKLILKDFLETCGFSGPNEPLEVKQDTLYPVHIAAHLGNYHLLRLLVAAGADLKQRTAQGRTAADLANGDERMQDFLRSGPKIVRFRDLRSEVSKMHSRAPQAFNN